MTLLNELRVGDVSDDSVRSRVKNFFEFDIVQIYVAPRSVRLFAAVIKSASTIGLNNRPQLQQSVAVATVVVVPVTVVVAAVVDAIVAAAVVVAVVVINVVVAISKV